MQCGDGYGQYAQHVACATNAHQCFSITARTTAARFSAVRPRCLNTAAPGADSPYRSTPSTAPLARTYFHQKSVTPASLAMRGSPAGSTAALYFSGWRSNTVVEAI